MNFKTPAINKSFDNLNNMGLILNLVSFARTMLLHTLHVNLHPKIFIIIFKTTEHM